MIAREFQKESVGGLACGGFGRVQKGLTRGAAIDDAFSELRTYALCRRIRTGPRIFAMVVQVSRFDLFDMPVDTTKSDLISDSPGQMSIDVLVNNEMPSAMSTAIDEFI